MLSLSLRFPPRGRKPRPLAVEVLEARTLPAGTWTALANLAPSSSGLGTMMLLSDGTVMVQGGGSAAAVSTWYQLTPDGSGSYVNGTWGQLASMGHTRLYYGSNVLTDGRVLVQGGEYSNAGSFTRTGEIYDPLADTWTNIQNFPLSQFGDDPTVMLPDGRVLAGYLQGPATYIYDPGADNWTFAANKLLNDRSDEETWIKLPDDSVLTYDVFANGHAQRYDPSLNQWVDAGNVPVNLSSGQVGSEMGPATMLPDGRALFVGATNHTALYDPGSNSWTAGPDMPSGIGADDAPGAMLPNGHFIFAADHPLFHAPTTIFDFDPATNSLTTVDVPSAVGLNNKVAYVTRMLVLPTGEILFCNATNQLWVYTPDGAPDPSWAPVINDISDNGDGSFHLMGTQLNGISEGASYGDDAEMSSNYPLVQLTDADGNVFYARTFNWSSTGVATGAAVASTEFTLPAGINPGDYSLSVVTNGIASDPVMFTVSAPAAAQAHRVGHAAAAGVSANELATATLTPAAATPFSGIGASAAAPAVTGDAAVVAMPLVDGSVNPSQGEEAPGQQTGTATSSAAVTSLASPSQAETVLDSVLGGDLVEALA